MAAKTTADQAQLAGGGKEEVASGGKEETAGEDFTMLAEAKRVKRGCKGCASWTEPRSEISMIPVFKPPAVQTSKMLLEDKFRFSC